MDPSRFTHMIDTSSPPPRTAPSKQDTLFDGKTSALVDGLALDADPKAKVIAIEKGLDNLYCVSYILQGKKMISWLQHRHLPKRLRFT